MKCRYTPIQMVKLKNNSVIAADTTKCCWGGRVTRTIIQCWSECRMVHHFGKPFESLIIEINIYFPYGPEIQLIIFIFFIFFFFWLYPWPTKFSGQRLNLYHSSDNTRFLTFWATRELWLLIHYSRMIKTCVANKDLYLNV